MVLSVGGLEMKDFVICAICGHKTRQIGYSHLWYTHRIKIKEYKEKFPNAEITCEETKDMLKMTAQNREPQSEETIAKISATMKDHYDNTPNFPLRKLHENSDFTGENNPFFGKHHTEEQKEKWSKAQTEKLLQEYREGKRVSAFKTLGHFKQSSKLELMVKEILDPLGFTHNFLIPFQKGSYAIDFAFVDKKFGIEIDSKLHDNSKYKDRDQRKDEYLQSLGWKIVRISVRNIKEVETLLSRIREVLIENKINTETTS